MKINRIKEKLLIAAGYKKVPSHVDAKTWYDEEWLTGLERFEPSFPRSHITRQGKDWQIHLDIKKDHGYNRNVIIEGFKLKQEIKRILSYSRTGYSPIG